jgi:hypothetical protein
LEVPTGIVTLNEDQRHGNRYVDTICTQGTDYHLLNGKNSPLIRRLSDPRTARKNCWGRHIIEREA